MRLTSTFLRRYRIERTSATRTERAVAVVRAFLTVTALVAIYLDATEPARLAAVTYAILAAYAVYSVVLLAVVHRAVRIAPQHTLVVHGIDILWSAVLTFVSEGPVSPFFLFFLFVVLAAAYRWGFWETVATTIVVILVFLVETIAASLAPWGASWMPLELNRTILRVAYLLLTGVLLGYLAEQEKNSRAELAAIADAARQPRLDAGLGAAVTGIAEGLLQTFEAAATAIVLRDGSSGRTLLWRLDRRDGAVAGATLRLELNPAEQEEWLFESPGRAWFAQLAADGGLATAASTQTDVWPLQHGSLRIPGSVTRSWTARTIMSANISLAEEWTGRLYVADAAPLDGLERGLHFLEALTDHIGSGLTNVLLLRRLRSQAGAAERARVARELHDGAIQSLLGIEMKVEALRREVTSSSPDVLGERLTDIQSLVHGEVLAMRELMQALKPIELDGSQQLPDVLASVVERFRRDSGVSARFMASGTAPSLPPATAWKLCASSRRRWSTSAGTAGRRTCSCV